MTLLDGYNLLHEGTRLFADMSHTGVCVDVPYLERLRDSILPQRIEYWLEELQQYPEIKKWKKREGAKWSPESDAQVKRLLYKQLKCKPPRGDYKTDKTTIAALNLDFADALLNYRKFKNCLSTFVMNLIKEQAHGYIHADMSLIFPVSYRGSCKMPNLQNNPSRDDVLAKMIKSCFIPRNGRQFDEYDFKAMEVCLSAAYHLDPNMIAYLTDPTKDMHWDVAQKVYCLEQWGKSDWADQSMFGKIRYNGKNGFVFPQFYGSWWKDCAYNMWQAVDELYAPTGITLREHLVNIGIDCLGELYNDDRGRLCADKGTFYQHMKDVEHDFWDKTFPVYNQWKQDSYKQYCETGEVHYKTGLRVRDILGRNDCNNYNIQGTAFQVLLKTLIETTKKIKRNKVEADFVLQVHDSGLNDHTPEAREIVDGYLLDVIKEEIPREWDWLCVPLTLEVKRGFVGGSWYDTKNEEKL
jgi:DNA polymerase I-like protein with 3'-5' exonuclease and polymerase domains